MNPKYNLDPDKMFEQAAELASLAPNIAIKLPATKSGLEAVERLSARGIGVNMTISFSVAQAVAAAEAIERGLMTYANGGNDALTVHPYVTMPVDAFASFGATVKTIDQFVDGYEKLLLQIGAAMHS